MGMFQRPDGINEPLYVITPIFNSNRFRSRWSLYEKFEKYINDSGAILHTVELAFGERQHAVTKDNDAKHLQLRTAHEIWYKEHLINLSVSRLPSDWKYVAWIDADVTFVRPDWVGETLHRLQHFPVVQMWTHLHDLDSQYQLNGIISSFAYHWINYGTNLPPSSANYPYTDGETKRGYPGAPGLAWAMERSAWNALGGLLDICILGAGDWYMAHALTNQIEKVTRSGSNHIGYVKRMLEWQKRAQEARWHERPIAGNIGVVPGVAIHYWHGPKSGRGYKTRDQILIDNQYNPDVDLKRDWQGLYQLTNNCPQLRRDLQKYFTQRNEDAL